ncbi:hypothetical protein Q8A67_007210 [Cirrhinus molitorella]|uniref:Uncharacterized protein n=1 Tax=Cirrhinus molitorella TaxID=172907 RepID=A0AA88TTL0_9TELE|nr:hypothetical protein Q8A67_007210 [Cirrhinus molitorella]
MGSARNLPLPANLHPSLTWAAGEGERRPHGAPERDEPTASIITTAAGARDGAFVVGKRKKVLDALSIVKIIIPTVTLMIHPSPPATSPRTTALLSPSPPASPFVPCVREYENPYNETILADGKRAPRAALATKTAQLFWASNVLREKGKKEIVHEDESRLTLTIRSFRALSLPGSQAVSPSVSKLQPQDRISTLGTDRPLTPPLHT